MQIVIDFVEGRMGLEEFKQAWYTNPEIGLWIENLLDLTVEPDGETTADWAIGYLRAIHKYYHGSVLKFISASEQSAKKHPSCWTKIGWHFTTIAAVVCTALPEVVPTSCYDEEQDFYFHAIGDYRDGPEVNDFVEQLLKQFPATMGKSKRLKAAKAAMREAFHQEDKRYPVWAQSSEWPMGTNTPMKFISRKRDGELVQFTFQDVDTGEIRMIEQFF